MTLHTHRRSHRFLADMQAAAHCMATQWQCHHLPQHGLARSCRRQRTTWFQTYSGAAAGTPAGSAPPASVPTPAAPATAEAAGASSGGAHMPRQQAGGRGQQPGPGSSSGSQMPKQPAGQQQTTPMQNGHTPGQSEGACRQLGSTQGRGCAAHTPGLTQLACPW